MSDNSVPAGPKLDILLAKAEPISDTGSTYMITWTHDRAVLGESWMDDGKAVDVDFSRFQ